MTTAPARTSIDERKLFSDLEYRFQYVAEFVGFGESDVAAIHASAAVLGPVVGTLVDAVYDKLFKYDATLQYFVPRNEGHDGSVPTGVDALSTDHPQIEFRKKHLARYLEALVTKPYDSSTVRYLDGVASIHTRDKGSPQIQVPLVHINALFGFVAAALIETIASFGLDSKVQTETQSAFMKLLWIQNDLFLRNFGN